MGAVCCPSRSRQEEEGTEDPAFGDSADVAAKAYLPEPDAQEDGGGQEARGRLYNTLVRVPAGAEGTAGCRGSQEEEGEEGEAVSHSDKLSSLLKSATSLLVACGHRHTKH